jgi:hypothetical protein
MRSRASALAGLAAVALVLGTAGTASADHTSGQLSPVVPQPSVGAVTSGTGTWTFLQNIGPMQGSDLEFFSRDGVTYVSAGTLGQAPSGTPGLVGQRIVALTDDRGRYVPPKVVADHGSASCEANRSATGLQHDVQAVPTRQTQLLIDTTDATGRCHDTPEGGLEIIDVSGLGAPGFQPKEIGLVRLNGLSHTVTADKDRPGILYNNGSDFSGMPWTDVVDVRSCMNFAEGTTLEAKRDACRPLVYRIKYEDEWTSKVRPDGTFTEAASCHDITYANDRLHCAALNASLIVDVAGMFTGNGDVKGAPLPCEVTDGTRTGAKVTDCSLGAGANPPAAAAVKAWEDAGKPQAQGWTFLGTVNHPGRDCGNGVTTCNTNLLVPSKEGVAVSHEADPSPDGRFMFVTDERGGGVVPPGATCAPGLDNPVGNGGIHAFDTSDPTNIEYALGQDGKKAVYIGGSPTPSPTFCTVHVIEHIPGEARIVAGYYDGGTKIIDYFVDEDGRITFKEVASLRLPGANTWSSEVFKVVRNSDGTNTYYFASTSFALGEGTARGVDVFSWRAAPNRYGDAVLSADERGKNGKAGAKGGDASGLDRLAALVLPTGGNGTPLSGPDAALVAMALVLLPLAAAVRVAGRRRVRAAAV